jgi:hypothetical protein
MKISYSFAYHWKPHCKFGNCITALESAIRLVKVKSKDFQGLGFPGFATYWWCYHSHEVGWMVSSLTSEERPSGGCNYFLCYGVVEIRIQVFLQNNSITGKKQWALKRNRPGIQCSGWTICGVQGSGSRDLTQTRTAFSTFLILAGTLDVLRFG